MSFIFSFTPKSFFLFHFVLFFSSSHCELENVYKFRSQFLFPFYSSSHIVHFISFCIENIFKLNEKMKIEICSLNFMLIYINLIGFFFHYLMPFKKDYIILICIIICRFRSFKTFSAYFFLSLITNLHFYYIYMDLCEFVSPSFELKSLHFKLMLVN